MSVPDAYGTTWYAATMTASPARKPLNVELDVDVCVIGGGLAGLTAAREIARRGWSVVLLEARRLACNASGRNTGFVLPGFAADPEDIIARVGRDRAKALWALSEAGVEYVRRTIHETAMPGAELDECGWMHVSKTDNDVEMAERARLLAEEFGTAAEFRPTERVRDELRSAHYFGGVHYSSAFSIHPLNYALGLAAAAEAAGARIYEETPALEIDPTGVRKRVTTPSARLRASHVVLAGNVHSGALIPQIASTLVPVSTYVMTTAPLSERLHEAIRYRGAVSDTELADNHYRVVGGDRLMWSGRCTLWGGDPQRYVKALISDLERTYPQLAGAQAEYIWRGTLGNTVHRMPQTGEVSPGLWLLSGFGGHGLNTTAMGGELIARGVVEGDKTWQLFSPFELVWAGGTAGRAVVQVYYWWFRARELLDAHLARRREAERKKALAPQSEQVAAPEPLAPPVVPADAEPGAGPATAEPKAETMPVIEAPAAQAPGPSDKQSAGGAA